MRNERNLKPFFQSLRKYNGKISFRKELETKIQKKNNYKR